ncbi:MAG: hypothetical protein H7338_05025 [Candidatus Sericytochromatia bacterium]|nr:hypothetical protein [Candidatus Sericytochromatia bacterium]
MRRPLALLLVALAALPVAAQTLPLGSSEKVFLPNSIAEAGGRFQLEEINTVLSVKPYAESFEATATRRGRGTKGADKLAAFISNGGRRATDVTEGGRRLTFTHVGDFIVVKMQPPLAAGSQRTLTMRYTGKAHAVSSKLIRDYKIDTFAIALRVLPLTGNMAATATLSLLGTGARKPDHPRPSLPPHIKPPVHWVPPVLAEAQLSKLGLVLNDNYSIDKVNFSGRPVVYTHAKGNLTVPITGPLAKGQRVPVTVAYTGKIRNSERNRIWDNYDNDTMPRNPLGAE